MKFSRWGPSAALFGRGFTNAVSPRPHEADRGTAGLATRVNCNGAGNFVVYESSNGIGGTYMICLNGYITAGCLVLLAGSRGIFDALSDKVARWIEGRVEDASSAGPQAKHDVGGQRSGMTWGQLHHYTSMHSDDTVGEEPGVATSPLGNHVDDEASGTGDGWPPLHMTAFDTHEDGFSATFSRQADGAATAKREPSCWEQIHIHYWAAAGHDSTVLTFAQLYTLVYHGMSNSYLDNYAAACYEMTNNGAWDGWLRVCYN
ncbi:hypothetical protein VTK73DRAFT_5087 [Phialemonium thermophilum]|uniref:Uncharacterized protein n=1 Tax=Phialemonium thermophilum TaxID=223376 RepID=A0ABR3WQ07_9PEZI